MRLEIDIKRVKLGTEGKGYEEVRTGRRERGKQ